MKMYTPFFLLPQKNSKPTHIFYLNFFQFLLC